MREILERGLLPVTIWLTHIKEQAYEAYDDGDHEFVEKVRAEFKKENVAFMYPNRGYKLTYGLLGWEDE